MTGARRLPGIQIDVAPPPAVEALPRLDVAVFIGFAATGPMHLPVAIESPAQFERVFGGDAPLAWDAQRGERVLAHLAPSVRAFFANGGRRCWVLRVARTTALQAALRSAGQGAGTQAVAQANRYAIPGVLALPDDDTGALAAATAQARCEGSWSDGLRISCALQRSGLAVSAWRARAASASPAGPARYAFTTRRALHVGELLQFGDDAGVCAYALVEGVRAAPSVAAGFDVEVRLCAAFERLQAGAALPSGAGQVSIGGFADGLDATLLGPAALRLDEPVSAQLEAGHWARFDAGAAVVWLRVDEIDRVPVFDGSPAPRGLMRAALGGPAWRELAPSLPPALGEITRAQVLEYELRVQGPQNLELRLGGQGLSPDRPGNFWEQQRDADHFAPRDGGGAAAAPDQPRFALAPEPGPLPRAWLPLGVPAVYGAAVGALPVAGSALERDGLAEMGSELFIDPELAADDADNLLAHAEEIRLLRPEPRRLFGLHAVLGIGADGLFNEASLLALPDAVHLGWQPRTEQAAAASVPKAPATPSGWRGHRGPCTVAPSDGGTSPLDEPDFGVFLDTGTRRLSAPVLDGPERPMTPALAYRLAWTDSEPGALYLLTESASGDFGDEREIYCGPATQHVLLAARAGSYHYRVLAQLGEQRSAASNPVTVQVRSDDWVQLEPAAADGAMEAHWLAVHRAALRLAGAGGDLFAVLGMPRHFRSAQAVRYTQRLRSVRQPPAMADALALGYREARVLSHGAIYYPWLHADVRGRAANTAGAASLRAVPPDGVAVGVLAARSARRGAWIAAANEAMKDVVALTPAVPAADWPLLQAAQINFLRADPRGFFTLAADTLALDEALRPINVRRLLILLRRLALRRGTVYAFEPNGPALRRAVQGGFDALMRDLYERGAFAGATPEQSYRVVTDDTVNTARDRDGGRFVVELRVAPSLPLRFLAVRLAQSGERLSVVEEL